MLRGTVEKVPGTRLHHNADICLRLEVREGVAFTRQTALPLTYAGSLVGRTYRPDFVVESAVVVEVKSAACVLPVHQAQVLSYLRLSQLERALIINFNVEYLIRGVKRLILTQAK